MFHLHNSFQMKLLQQLFVARVSGPNSREDRHYLQHKHQQHRVSLRINAAYELIWHSV